MSIRKTHFRALRRRLRECAYLIVLGFFLAAASSCSRDRAGSQDLPGVLRVGVLPDESEEQVRAKYAGLITHLEKELDLSIELVLPESYEHLQELFDSEKVQLANFGGLTFVRCVRECGAVPLVMRDVDLRFTSYFLVRSDDPAQGIEDCRGRTISFGSELSTSGNLMPRYFLSTMDIVPETFFSEVQYSGSHDATALRVQNKLADVGAANSRVIDKMFERGELLRDQVRVLWETPPYADYVWAGSEEFSAEACQRIRDAFLTLSNRDPENAAILDRLDADHYLPASQTDFSELESFAIELGILEGTP